MHAPYDVPALHLHQHPAATCAELRLGCDGLHIEPTVRASVT